MYPLESEAITCYVQFPFLYGNWFSSHISYYFLLQCAGQVWGKGGGGGGGGGEGEVPFTNKYYVLLFVEATLLQGKAGSNERGKY